MKLSYLQTGEGKDLVLLHGYLASKESFAPQIAYFSRRFRVTALDFPGFGGAEPLSAAWSVGDYADWTMQALASIGIAFPHVVAHSFGGRVAVKCLARGDVFDRAVLAGCAGIVPRRTLRYRVRVKTYRFFRRVAPRWADAHFGSSEYRSLPPVMRESYKKIVNEDLRGDAERIARPVLFVNGTRDAETPPASIRVYLSRVKGSSVFWMEDCGHFAFLDNPLAFNAATEEFLQ